MRNQRIIFRCGKEVVQIHSLIECMAIYKPLGFCMGINGFVVGYLDMDCMKEIILDIIQNATVGLLILFPAVKFLF